MTYFPQPHPRRRATRVRLQGAAPADIRVEDGRRITGKLQTISVTGGLLRLTKPLHERALVELMILTHAGPVLGVAEMLSCASAAAGCAQPFRFLALDDGDYQRLRGVIESWLDRNIVPVRPLAAARAGSA